MPIDGFAADKCARRNKYAALQSFEAAPVRLGGSGVGRVALPEGAMLIDSAGDLPERKDTEGILSAVNGLLPEGMEPLSPADLYYHPIEAASGRFISDRYAFLHETTLRNIASGGARGVAFMNSHRTGGYSTESELPFGKTAAGRFEQWLLPDGEVFERALLGFYMLRGIAPTGASGPDTDTLDRMIRGGVLQDVSVGLGAGVFGRALCDVCGNNYNSSDCRHYAGTSHRMELEDMERQRARGVPTGRASYTLYDYEIGEVSGVYDGAVPGAGFSKGFEMFTAGRLPERAAVEFADAFGHLLRK
jgi:hypothetical protein